MAGNIRDHRIVWDGTKYVNALIGDEGVHQSGRVLAAPDKNGTAGNTAATAGNTKDQEFPNKY